MLPKVSIYNTQGVKVGEQELNPAIFAVLIKAGLLHQVVTAQMANQRQVLAHTKGRGEVSGGGRKPWRQKGTGRARHGSIRSPIWRGGGVTFGPTKERVFKQKINKKVRDKALRMALSDKALNKLILVLENLEIGELKTKNMFKLLQSLKIATKKRVFSTVIALAQKEIKTLRSIRNISNIVSYPLKNINVLDLVKHKYLLITAEGLKELEEKLK